MGERVWAVVVAAGSGSRFGGPKQDALLGRRSVLSWSLEAARAGSDGVVVVVRPDRAGGAVPAGADRVVAGGATRSQSVRAGLAALAGLGADDHDVVVVHDAARPLAGPGLFAAVVAAVRAGADGAVPGVGVTDTVKLVDEAGAVVATPPRERLRAVQTPQAFRLGALRRAHAGGAEATDDAALLEAAGARVVVVDGEPDNRKITTPDDLAWARTRLAGRP